MNLFELLADQPPVNKIPDIRHTIREALVKSKKRLVVVDDDPTGMQAVQDVNIYMDWSVATLRKALSADLPVFFVSVNSRSLAPSDARELAWEVGQNLRQAVDLEHSQILLASRSDSTLRGHFPYEVEALIAGFGLQPDGIIFTPALLEAGRYTVGDVHWAEQGGQLVPVSETEFARDPMFPFKNSNLKAWIEEKHSGNIRTAEVISVSLHDLRVGGMEAVTRLLMSAANGRYIITNAAAYEDLDVFALAVQAAESRGKTYIYRCSASFLKSRGGFPDRALLTTQEMVSGQGPGLILAGSYVEKTTRQLNQLSEAGLVVNIELAVSKLFQPISRQREIARAAAEVGRNLEQGRSVILYTTRRMRMQTGEDFAAVGKSIMAALCDVVSRITVRPGYMVAKGGITSIEAARVGLQVKEAYALGQILPGVPVWRLGMGSRWPGLTYVVFPGNVGDDTALFKAVKTLRGD
jgi:uncharacterized protein YgbK (DUF1537 family)